MVHWTYKEMHRGVIAYLPLPSRADYEFPKHIQNAVDLGLLQADGKSRFLA